MMTTDFNPSNHALLRLTGTLTLVTGIIVALIFTTHDTAVPSTPNPDGQIGPDEIVFRLNPSWHRTQQWDTIRPGNLLLLLDGREIAIEQFNMLDKNSFYFIDILTGDMAVSFYGERAKHGALLFSTISAAETAIQNGKADEVFCVAEQMPVFQGGDLTQFRKWLTNNLHCPDEKEKGRVVAWFIVQKDGSVGNVKILQSFDEALSEEVVRVLESFPAWEPGRQKGETVEVSFVIPVLFDRVD